MLDCILDCVRVVRQVLSLLELVAEERISKHWHAMLFWNTLIHQVIHEVFHLLVRRIATQQFFQVILRLFIRVLIHWFIIIRWCRLLRLQIFIVISYFFHCRISTQQFFKICGYFSKLKWVDLHPCLIFFRLFFKVLFYLRGCRIPTQRLFELVHRVVDLLLLNLIPSFVRWLIVVLLEIFFNFCWSWSSAKLFLQSFLSIIYHILTYLGCLIIVGRRLLLIERILHLLSRWRSTQFLLQFVLSFADQILINFDPSFLRFICTVFGLLIFWDH